MLLISDNNKLNNVAAAFGHQNGIGIPVTLSSAEGNRLIISEPINIVMADQSLFDLLASNLGEFYCHIYFCMRIEFSRIIFNLFEKLSCFLQTTNMR